MQVREPRVCLPVCLSYDGRGRGESGRVNPPDVGNAVCGVPVCDWDDVGSGRRTYEHEHVQILQENMLDESGRLDHTRATLALHRTMDSFSA
jgi:hypothetical protein